MLDLAESYLYGVAALLFNFFVVLLCALSTNVSAQSSIFGVDLETLGLSDFNSGSPGDIAVDTDQLVCDPETDTLEDFYPTELIAGIANNTSTNFLVRFARIKVRDAQTGERVFSSKNLGGSYANVPPGEKMDFITILATPQGANKVFIGTDIRLADHKTALNVEVTLRIKTPYGRIRRRGTILMVPISINKC